MVFHWERNISDYYGAMTFMNNTDTSLATVKINMLTQDSFVLDDGLFYQKKWYILAEFPHLTDVPSHEIDLPAVPYLCQNYPNPFNPSTSIQFILPHETLVTITVYDLLGRKIKVLVQDQRFNRGEHRVEFSASSLSSGIYFYRLTATNGKSGLPEFTDVKKMAICK